MASCAIHLKSKVYFLRCPKQSFPRPYDFYLFQNDWIETLVETDYSLMPKRIAEYDFHGYASFILFVDYCLCCEIRETLCILYKAIKNNLSLKYVLKVIIPITYLSPVNKNYVIRRFLSPQMERIHAMFFSMNNMIILGVDLNRLAMIRNMTKFLRRIFSVSQTKCIQELVKRIIPKKAKIGIYFLTLTTTCNAGGFIYNINPAIAIIINHQSFFNNNVQFDVREGSSKDIEALEQSFRSKKISYFTISDGSLEDVQAIVQKIQTIKFKGIKDLYLVIMSHGDEGDLIYTKTKSYSIRDEIVLPILKNPTLANVQKYLIVNACRGSLDPRFAEDLYDVEREMQKFPCHQDTYPHDENLMMIFSTQKGCVSLRFDIGSIFVQVFCTKYGADFDEKSMEMICQETKEQMEYEIWKDQIPDFQMSEERPHQIKMEFANFCHNQKLLNDIFEFYSTHFKEYITDEGNNEEIDADLNISQIGKYSKEGQLLGMGYADRALTKHQKKAVEVHMKSEYDAILRRDQMLGFDWCKEKTTGRSRLLVKTEFIEEQRCEGFV